jgi:FixJ family two-component response regulator
MSKLCYKPTCGRRHGGCGHQEAGAEDFIEKPIDDSKLVAAINRGLARRFELQQQQETIQDLRARFDRLTPREVQVLMRKFQPSHNALEN